MNLIPLYLIIYLYGTVYAHCRSVRILLAMFLYMLTIHDVCISMYNTFVYLIVLEKAINITPKKINVYVVYLYSPTLYPNRMFDQTHSLSIEHIPFRSV